MTSTTKLPSSSPQAPGTIENSGNGTRERRTPVEKGNKNKATAKSAKPNGAGEGRADNSEVQRKAKKEDCAAKENERQRTAKPNSTDDLYIPNTKHRNEHPPQEEHVTEASSEFSQLLDETMQRNSTLQTENNRLQAEIAGMKELLRQQRIDLATAEAFLNRADTISEADVKRMVGELNDEIFQCAALLVDGSASSFAGRQPIIKGREWITQLIGEKLVQLLERERGNQDRIQVAICGLLTSFCSWVAGLWLAKPHPGEIDGFLKELNRQFRKTEMQSVTGKWRSLTRVKCRELLVSQPQNSGGESTTEAFTRKLVGDLANLLIIGGINSNHGETCIAIRSLAEPKLRVLVKKTLSLNKALGEEVQSVDLCVSHFPSGTPFDPLRMNNAGGGVDPNLDAASKSRPSNILCTTELGLIQLSQNTEQPPRFLLKPGVMLETALA